MSCRAGPVCAVQPRKNMCKTTCRIYGSRLATWARAYRSRIYLPCKIYCTVHHKVGIGEMFATISTPRPNTMHGRFPPPPQGANCLPIRPRRKLYIHRLKTQSCWISYRNFQKYRNFDTSKYSELSIYRNIELSMFLNMYPPEYWVRLSFFSSFPILDLVWYKHSVVSLITRLYSLVGLGDWDGCVVMVVLSCVGLWVESINFAKEGRNTDTTNFRYVLSDAFLAFIPWHARISKADIILDWT